MKSLALAGALGFALATPIAVPADSNHLTGRTVMASWYGPGLYGNSLACGGRLSSSTVGVAHKYLPCGSSLRVCYRGRCVHTRVVDRGPFVAGRELDLTAGLAWRLRFSGVGAVYCSRC